jgi:glycosyltransferase involved in cell wall biosynthesis
MANKKFSIIIPAYNYAHYLPRALNSILGQTGDDYDVTVINDGSTDETEAVVQPLLKQFPGKLHYVFQENRGLAGARNRGVVESQGEYLIFVDADDCLVAGALDIFRNYLDKNPDTDMVFGAYYSVYEDGLKKLRRPPVLSDNPYINFKNYIQGKFVISNGSLAIRRKVFDKIKYPESARNNEHYVMDGQMLALYRCASIQDPVLEVYAHDSRLRQDIESIEKTGLSIVDLLFDKDLLPGKFMSLKNFFLSRLLLSRFRTYYQAGLYSKARSFYIQAIKTRPINITRASYFKKYLKSFLLPNKEKQPV